MPSIRRRAASAYRDVRRVPSRARAGARLARIRLRRSLMARVVGATVALGVVVVFALGQFLLQKISDDLVHSRTLTALAQSRDGSNEVARNWRNWHVEPDRTFGMFLSNETNQLAGPEEHQLREVLFLHALRETNQGVGEIGQDQRSMGSAVSATSIPTDLRDTVNRKGIKQQYARIVSLPLRPNGARTGTRQAIAVGGLVDFGSSFGGWYELYFFYPLDNEVAILGNVQRVLTVGGVALVALVGAVAWIVTRQVVAPVRQAVRTAEQLASGRLDRRMRVRGEDDLARLARAFNEMAASLERQIHQLEELSRVQRRFVSDVSHELRTPLTTIRMAGEVMYEARDTFDPASSRSAELLRDQLDRFEALLADLLEVSRFDAGAAQLELETMDVREAVHRVVDGLRPLAERRGVALTVKAPTPGMAEFDQRRVERVIRNLVGNAIEHGEGKPVLITVAQDADAVAVCVRDHGAGLRPSEQRLVFNRFWRADASRARSTGGTGLGLAIALEDAHLHGGWLQVWGAPGLGANFRLTLPRRAGVVLAGSPLPLVPPDVPSSARSTAPERTPVAMVVAAGGTQVVASDGAASVLASDSSGAISLPPLRAGSEEAPPERQPSGPGPGSGSGAGSVLGAGSGAGSGTASGSAREPA